MNKREYLRSLGFEVGSRGRFSAEMIEALKQYPGESVSDPLNDLLNQPLNEDGTLPGKIVFKINPPRTDGVTTYTAVLNNGITVRFDTCPQCKENVKYCYCKDPQPPDWLRDDVDTWTVSG